MPIPPLMIEETVRAALREDLGRGGDITSAALIPPDQLWQGKIVARQEGVLAGMAFAHKAFALMDDEISLTPLKKDGDTLAAGEVIATLSGNALAMLAAERTALNFLTHLSGIASLTRRYVNAAQPHKARICCTRKTIPLLRMAQKEAVRLGGGINHRMGLDDAVLIKDNHIAVVGDIRTAACRAREVVGHMVKIEVEVDSLDQLRALLEVPACLDAVLLDNMPPATLTEAVALVNGRWITEASGGVSLDTVNAIAASDVDVISVGALTHSAPHLDIALDEG